MLLKEYGVLFIFTMSLLTTTPLFAPPGDGTDDVRTTSTRSLSSENTELTPEECNRRYLYSEAGEEEILEPTVVDRALATASAILTPVLDSLSDPTALVQDASHSVADLVIKGSPKAVHIVHKASHAVADLVIQGVDVSATIARSAVSTILQLPPVAHMQNAYNMYTLGEETGEGIVLILPPETEEDGFVSVVDMNNKPPEAPLSASVSSSSS